MRLPSYSLPLAVNRYMVKVKIVTMGVVVVVVVVSHCVLIV